MNTRALAIEAWESLFRAQYEIFSDIGADFTTGELAQPEYDVLLTVTREPDRTARMKRVTDQMLISQPSVSRLIDRMVTRGLVLKLADPDDGRGALVRITPLGEQTFRTVSVAHGKSIAERMSALTDDELRSLHALTQKLRRVDQS